MCYSIFYLVYREMTVGSAGMGFFAGLKCFNAVLVLIAVTLASSVMGEDNVPTQSLD